MSYSVASYPIHFYHNPIMSERLCNLSWAMAYKQQSQGSALSDHISAHTLNLSPSSALFLWSPVSVHIVLFTFTSVTFQIPIHPSGPTQVLLPPINFF